MPAIAPISPAPGAWARPSMASAPGSPSGVTSIALVPLVIWAVYSALLMSASDYVAAMLWVHSPLNAVLLCLLLAVGFWHMHAGMRVVAEDYVQGLTKTALLLINLFVCVLGGALAIFAVAEDRADCGRLLMAAGGS